MENSKRLLEVLRLEKERLSNNHQVPVDELKTLVFTTYSCGMMSEGRAAELLCLNRLDFRRDWGLWLVDNLRMLDIWEHF